ncbi:hypothetical protein ONZ45_g633 [Pleurotus djamor]|nr:hypothetical protein ONZ45_g633 [Pleurotus djamor]
MSAALKTGQSQPSSLPAGKLPFELWKMVVDELGCTFRRNELLPLLCTSRFFHALVAPIFYETIALHGYALMSRAPAPATYANRRHPKRPCVGLHNPSLSQHTRSIFEICLSTDENVNVVSECFSHLTNLERLSLCSDEDEFTLLLGAIPLSAPLSHLSILPEYECSALGAFLTAHSSTLRFIKIQCGNSDNVVKLAFPSTLPHLHVFEGPSCIWEEVIKVAPIKHLATNDTLETIDVALAYDLFDNLTSFMFGLYQIDVMSPLLRNISALHISIDEDDGPEVATFIIIAPHQY